MATVVGERAEIRQVVHYLRQLRKTVQRAAADHSAWAYFVGSLASRLRMAPEIAGARDVEKATRYAMGFSAMLHRLRALQPAQNCLAAHEAAIGWLEALDLLAEAVPIAIQARSVKDLDAIAREASEARIRLRTFERLHTQSLTTLRRLVHNRPRVRAPRVRLAAPRPATPTPPRAPTAAPLPPWRRPVRRP